VKICLFIGLVGPKQGGLQVLAHRLAQQLKKQGHDVRIIARTTEAYPIDYLKMEAPRVFTIEGVDVEIISVRGWRRWLLLPVHYLLRRPKTFPIAVALYQAAFRSVVDRASNGTELIHYFGYGVQLLGYAAWAAARQKNIPFIVQPAIHVGQSGHGHGDLPLYKAADMVIAHTDFEAGALHQFGIKATHVRTVPLGFDRPEPGDGARFRKAHGIEGPMVLFVGRRCEDKGYFLLLKIFALLRKHVPNVTLVIAGPGDDAPSKAEGVLELGRVTDEIKQDALSACTVFCVPSSGESFGIAYFEAWNYSKPVVALDLPILRGTIGASGGGLLADPARPEDLVEKLTSLLEQPDVAVAMGVRGHEFSKGYSWETMTKWCLNAYSDAQQNHRR